MQLKLDEKKVCFVTPPSAFSAYTGTAINAATQVYPILAYQYLSAWLKRLALRFKVKVFDMGIESDAWPLLAQFLLKERPKYLGLSFTTPLFYEAKLIGLVAKSLLGPDLIIIHGNIHASALFEESLTETMCDVVVKGEGEITFGEICQGKPLNKVDGIAYRVDDGRRQSISAEKIILRLLNGESCYDVAKNAIFSEEPEIKQTKPRPYISNLDDLPFPDMELYDIYSYKNPDIIAHGYPLQQVETSRGCPFSCNFCSSEDTYRTMSPDYVIGLFKYLVRHGVKELRVIDDQFLVDINRGKSIAQKMLETDMKVFWNMANGVRADRVDREFLNLVAASGCYQIGCGFESGDQDTLNSISKGLNLDKSFECVKMMKEIGIEIVGFFMFGAPAETERSMQRTIDFAKKLMPDFAKVTICIPFPDTKLYTEYKERGLILTKKWDEYNIHKAARIYKHPNDLTPEILEKYYWKFYRKFYLNPRYVLRKTRKSLQDGTFFRNVNLARKLFLAKWLPDNPRNWVTK
jgi:anaerobic magnesium-protoporphyrin IX monomethyl ester cyclase